MRTLAVFGATILIGWIAIITCGTIGLLLAFVLVGTAIVLIAAKS